MKITPLFVLLFLLLSNALIAQESGVYFRNYASEIVKTEQGLSQNSVRSIMQDSHGLLWFGTWDGLNRFNGLDFEIFRSEYSGKSGQLPNHTINSIYEDREGLIWIGTEEGLSRLNPFTESYRSYFYSPNCDSCLSNDTIKTIVQDREGNLWIGTQNGLSLLTDTAGSFKTYFHSDSPNSIPGNKIRHLFEDREGNIWISSTNGLGKWITAEKKFLQIPDSALIHSSVNVALQLNNGNIAVGTEQGLSIISADGSPVKHIAVPASQTESGAHIMDLCLDAKGKLWLATSGDGIFFYYPQQDELVSLASLPEYRDINENYVNAIYEDQQGIIWIGYAWKGLNKVVPGRSYFRHYKKQTSENDGLASNSVWSMTQSTHSQYFIGTDKGINIYNNKDKSFDLLDLDDGLSSLYIRAMKKDRNQNIWIGTLDKGLMKYDIRKNTFTHFGHNNTGPFSALYNNAIWAILEDHEGKIWLGTAHGLHYFDPHNEPGQLTSFYKNHDRQNSISSNVIYSLFQDQQQNIWIGSYNGLIKYSPPNKSFTTYKHIIGDSTSISTNKIFSVNQDENGFLWIGTRGGGLNKMNPYNETFRHYIVQDGLSNNVVYDILIDPSGNLWLSTNKGLSRFDPQNETFVNYDIKDGIQSYEFNLGAAFKSRRGEMFFGGMNGFNAFYPEEIKESQIRPDLVITDIRIFNQSIPGIYLPGDTLHLSHAHDFVSLTFAALDYSNPQKNQYKYKLEGISNKWITTTADNNVAEFTNLPPGKYTFYLKGTNSDGIWSDKVLNLHIHIKPAWYQTQAFRLGSLALAVLIIFLLIHTRINQIKKKHLVEKQLFELERKALRLQINPHFIFNTLNSIQNYILEHNKTSAISYLNKFSKMMRQVLYNSDKTFVTLSDEIALLKNYIELERLRFDTLFDYSFNIPDQLEEDFIAIPPMLIQPHVENAILHGLVHLKNRKGNLSISFRAETQETIQCIIDDNGIGRKASEALKQASKNKHKSRGISITRERLERINQFFSSKLSVDIQDKYDEEGNAAGTRIILIMPVENT